MYLQMRNDSSTRDVFSEKSLTQFWSAKQQSHPKLALLTGLVVCFH